MILLSESERTEVVANVRDLIIGAGQEGILLRAVPGERLYGGDDPPFEEIARFPGEFVLAPAKSLIQDVDGIASVLPGLDVRAQDRISHAGAEYRVQTVKEEWLFGVVTHQTLELVRIHGG